VLSGEPIVDPYNEIILELTWSEGSYLREYALRFGASTRVGEAPVATTASITSAASAPDPQPEVAPPESRLQAQTTPQTEPSAENGVPVSSGDSLFSVARALAIPGVSNEQIMLAIYRSNPQAFAGGPDNLLAGATLTIPPRAQIVATPTDQNSQVIPVASPREQVSEVAATTTNADATSANNVAVSDDTLSERDPTLALYDGGVSPADNVESDNAASLVAANAATSATTNTTTNATTNLSLSRVVSLDTHDAVLQRQADSSLLTQQLAGLDASLNAVSSQLSNMESSVTALSASVEETTFKVGNLDDQIDGIQSATTSEAVIQTPAANAAKVVNGNQALPAAQTEVPVANSGESNLAEGIQGSIALTKGRWGNFMESGYLRSLVLLGIALALAMFMIARQILSQRKNRIVADEKLQPAKSVARHRKTESKEEADADDTAVGTRQPSVLRRQEESVDAPTALTWFREHLQSSKVGEEALVKALRQHPNRQDLRLRLMERYANRKEVESFAQLGREMFLMTRGRNKEWPQAIQLALALELEMESMEPQLVPSYRAVDLGIDRDIESPFSGDSTQQFLAFGRELRAKQSSNATGMRRSKGRRNPLRPDVRLDQTLI